MRVLLAQWMVLIGLLAPAATAQIGDLLQPLPGVGPGGPEVPVPLQPPANGGLPPGSFISRREGPPPRPAFDLRQGDRVVWLGDTFLAGELESGYLETRLTAQFPDRQYTFLHLPWLTNQPLASVGGPVAADWLTNFLREVAAVKPTVAIVAYGTTAAAAGTNALPAFEERYGMLLDGLRSLNTNEPLRLVVVSPGVRMGNTNEATARFNAAAVAFTDSVARLATNHAAEFVNVASWFDGDVRRLMQIAQERKTAYPAIQTEDQQWTPYGWNRLSLALENSLRWQGTSWRLGFLPNQKFRSGGFGLQFRSQSRSETNASLRMTEVRLPSPNPPGFVDQAPNSRPQCYMQVPGLRPGRYRLQVDNRTVIEGNHAAWGRYEIITQGPSWDQVEELRQAIVKKNRTFVEHWQSAAAARKDSSATLVDDPAVRELETTIGRLKQPAEHSYVINRVGDAAADAPPD